MLHLENDTGIIQTCFVIQKVFAHLIPRFYMWICMNMVSALQAIVPKFVSLLNEIVKWFPFGWEKCGHLFCLSLKDSWSHTYKLMQKGMQNEHSVFSLL